MMKMFIVILIVYIINLNTNTLSNAAQLEPLLKRFGSTLCQFFTLTNFANRKHHKYCGIPTCNWDSW